jgi:uncharacterized protein
MPINASHEYMKAEKDYLNAKSLEDKIFYLEEMIKTAPKHKGSENLLKELRIRLKKFKGKVEKGKKGRGGKKGIRKEGFQFVMIGKSNSGKSSLLKALTNAKPVIADYQYTTKHPEIGTFSFDGINAQIVDNPSIRGEDFDVGLSNNCDCLLMVVEDLEDLKEIENYVKRARGKRLAVVNKSDKLTSSELRRLEARMKSKKIDGVIVSANSGKGIEELKQRLISETGMIRIYMKEPGKKKHEERPMVLREGSTVKDVAEHILKGFSKNVRGVNVTGPSSKFPKQRVGMNHVLKDKDIIEFHTR